MARYYLGSSSGNIEARSEDAREIMLDDTALGEALVTEDYWSDYDDPFEDYDCGYIDHSISRYEESMNHRSSLIDLMN